MAYEIGVVLLLLVAITPAESSLADLVENPLGALRVNNTVLGLVAALFIPFVLPHLRKLKIFGAEIELAKQVERVSRDVEEVKRATNFDQFKQRAAMFTIATSLSRNMFIDNVQNRRAGKTFAAVPFTVGQLDFVESWIVTGLVYEHLRNHASEHPDKFQVAPMYSAEPTLLTFFRLLAGKLDMFIWYSGTGIKMADQTFTPEEAVNETNVRRRLNNIYAPLGLVWLKSLGFENDEHLVMLERTARQMDIRTIEDLKNQAPQLIFGANQEYFLRDWRFPKLERAGVRFKDRIDDLSLNDRVSGLFRRDFDVGVISETHPDYGDSRLRTIQPDTTFPRLPQFAMPICRSDTIDADIGGGHSLATLLEQIRIDRETMHEINREAGREGLRAADGLVVDGIVKRFMPRVVHS